MRSCLICVPGSSFWTLLVLKQLYIVLYNLDDIFCYSQFSCKFCILFFNRSSPSSWDTDVLAEISKWKHIKLNSRLWHLASSKEHNGSIHKNGHIQVREMVFKLPGCALTDLWLFKYSNFYRQTNHSLWKFRLCYYVTA